MDKNDFFTVPWADVDFTMSAEEKVAYIDSFLDNVGLDTDISHGEIIALKSQRNALQPINKLPDEILSKIFLLLLPVELYYYGWRWSAPYKTCLTLACICRLWRNVALDCPQFWSKLTYRRNEKSYLIELFLERSKRAKLEISFGDHQWSVPLEILRLLSGSMHRVVSFEIYSVGYLSIIQELLNSAGPSLKNLNLQSELSATDFTYPGNSFNPVQLDKIYLRNVSFDWSSEIFRGLTSLVLIDARTSQHEPKLSEFLNILEACPALRELDVENTPLEMSGNIERRLIYLPRLESLRLWVVTFDAYLFLSECIIIPKDVEWKVNCHQFPFEQPELFTANLPERSTQCDSFVIATSSLDFSVRTMGSTGTCTDLVLDWHLNSSLQNPSPQTVNNLILLMTETLFGKWYWNNPTEVTFNMGITYNDLVSPFWTRILTLIPHVRSMVINFRYGDSISNLKGFIDALTDSIGSDLHLPAWRCPNLEDLTIYYVLFSTGEGLQAISKLVDYLQQRKRRGHTLRMLHFRSCRGFTQKEEDNLRDLNVVGEIKVT